MSQEGTLDQRTGMWGRMRPFLLERPAPCQNGCPAGIPIPKALKYLQEKEFDEAIRCIREENPFPGITGRVCFHSCEENCNRKYFDQAISIRSLERFLSQLPLPKSQPTETNGKKNVAVIGSGPAGLSCSYYLALFGYRITLFEAEKKLGGMLRFGIPRYRLPEDILDREIENLLSLGVEPITGKKIGRDLLFKQIYQDHDAVFIATGAWNSLKINVPGEESFGIVPALDLLREVNRGERLALGKNVLVIGGGNSALDAARTSLRMESQVKILYRRSRQEMPAFPEEVEEAEEEGIDILYLTSPVGIRTRDGKMVGLECVRNRLTEPGKDGRAIPVAIPNSNHLLEADTLVTAVGESPDLSFLYPEVRLKGEQLETEVLEKLFTGGDLLPQPRTVIHAIQSGKEGAMRIDQYLKYRKKFEKTPWTSVAAYRRSEAEAQGPAVKFEELNMSYFDHQDRAEQMKFPPDRRKSNFAEISQTLTEDEAVQEGNRCFQCGVCTVCENCYIFCPDFVVSIGEKVVIDYEHCKGCCICVEECPRGAMASEVKV